MLSEPISPRRLVRPRPLRWYHRWAAMLIYVAIRTMASTVRLRGTLPESLRSIPGDQPVIFCIWHNRLFLSLILYRLFVRRQKRSHRMAALVSASRDGGILARVLGLFRVQPVRGSSSRRGPQALLELTTWAERGYDLAITPDGPRGPRYVIQTGVVSLAQLTGLPVIPVSYRLSWKFQLRSWDRFQVPFPLCRCDFQVAEPLLVPRTASESEREQLRVELEDRMRRVTFD